MWKTVLKLPNGSLLSSGTSGADAIRSFTLTQCVNEEQELTMGSVCAAMAELTVISTGTFPVSAGEELEIWREDPAGNSRKIGIFIAEKPVRASSCIVKLTAYDRVIRLDRDLTGWLEGLTDWPYKLGQLGQMVCQACGVTLASKEIPNGDFPVAKFSACGVTGRQLMRWIGELSGCFCRCNGEGVLEFSWYVPSDKILSPGGEHFYFQNGFSHESYQTEKIHQVRIQQGQDDVGTVYPDTPAGDNAYTVTGNPLAPAGSAGALIGLAQTLYERLQDVTYTPCKVELPGDWEIACGQILTITDARGQAYQMYVMHQKQSGGRQTLECTGSRRRDSTTAVNNTSYRALSGKVLNLQTTVDGLRVENRENGGKLAGLAMDVEGITSEVSRQQTDLSGVKTQMTAMAQTAESVDIRIQQITQSGVQKVKTETGFTLDAGGLTISREGTRMENLVNESGMYVKRSGEVLLKADQGGVTAVDVSVGNYLIVGDHARFEDYVSGGDSKRTACFWI